MFLHTFYLQKFPKIPKNSLFSVFFGYFGNLKYPKNTQKSFLEIFGYFKKSKFPSKYPKTEFPFFLYFGNLKSFLEIFGYFKKSKLSPKIPKNSLFWPCEFLKIPGSGTGQRDSNSQKYPALQGNSNSQKYPALALARKFKFPKIPTHGKEVEIPKNTLAR